MKPNRPVHHYEQGENLPSEAEAIARMGGAAFRERWLERIERLKAGEEVEKGYDPAQPRVPAGNPDGGQWTGGGRAFDQPELDPYNFGASVDEINAKHQALYERSGGSTYPGAVKALKLYADEGYEIINKALRSPMGRDTLKGDPFEPYVDDLDMLFDKAELAQPLTTYRWMNDKAYAELKETAKASGAVVDRGFVSTTADPDQNITTQSVHGVGGPNRVTIQIPKGAKALPIAHLSSMTQEREVLIARGQTFDVRQDGDQVIMRLRPNG